MTQNGYVNATCRIDPQRIIHSIFDIIEREYDDLHTLSHVPGWPVGGRDPLVEYKYPEMVTLKMVMVGSFVNHLYYRRMTGLFQYSVYGIKRPFAEVTETKVREVVETLRYDGLVGKYNDVVITDRYVEVRPTESFIAVERLARGEEIWLPPELDLMA